MAAKKKAAPVKEPESDSGSDSSEEEDIVEDKMDVPESASESESEVEEKELEKPEANKPKRPNEDKQTIFVGNLPVNTKKEQLKKFFASFGAKTVRLRSQAGKKIYSKQMVTKDPFITAFVVMDSEASAEKAVEMSGKMFRDRRIRVTLAGQKKGANRKTVFVGNLPYSTVDEDLYEVFGTCGEIESIRTIRGPNGCTGIAYVSFKEQSSLVLALELQGTMIKDRPIRLEKCKDMKKAERKNTKKEETKVVHKFVNGKHIRQQQTPQQQPQQAKAGPSNANNALKRLQKKPGLTEKNNNANKTGPGQQPFKRGNFGPKHGKPGQRNEQGQGGPSKGGAKRTGFKPKPAKKKGLPKNIQLAKRLNVNWKKPTYKAGPKKTYTK